MSFKNRLYEDQILTFEPGIAGDGADSPFERGSLLQNVGSSQNEN